MAVDHPLEEEVQAVFGVSLDGGTLQQAAAASDVLFVRSQIQVAKDNSRATGMRLLASEALQQFGWQVLRQLANRNAVPIVRTPGEPGASIAEMRLLLGLDDKRVAAAANLSSDDLTAFEQGRSQLPIRKIHRISQALSVNLDAPSEVAEQLRVGEKQLALRLREFSDRSEKIKLSPALVVSLSEAGWVIKKQSTLQAELDLPSESITRSLGFLPSAKYGPPPYRFGYKLAHRTRHLLGLSQAEPIKSLRALVEEKLRIPIVQADLPAAFAGATISNGSTRGIVLNLQGFNENPWVRRNTLAHELGHILWDPEDRLNALRVDKFTEIDQSSAHDADPVESRANAFAAEFLAPREAVLEIIKDAPSDAEAIERVCNWFGIGPSAARYQIQNADKTRLSLEMPHYGINPTDDWKIAEDFAAGYLPVLPDALINRRGRFAYWVAKAVSRKLISLDTAGSYMGLDRAVTPDEVAQLLELYQAANV
ncbi:ImmA/IrrE family metallo-endopeptidase [Burkholderia contaminans]|uniref:ImmA/IrrE family metallo-endopeptidase n=1 Tax=Burkholderia contaminans TaxID=488447 RepID=A0A3N8QTN2_9BURK|nr:ImmA/IrrE family metallo-endopeptidase [Burkholderia contaminans]RQT22666.1 ImmA/IrrE family metallo-endopeptidase [Burkholderia contaminans]